MISTREMISIMQQSESGKQMQEETRNGWRDLNGTPDWNWIDCNYRAKPNRYRVVLDRLIEEEIDSAIITFGGVEHNDTGDIKLVYDTHIRNVILDNLKIGKTVKFRLVPVNEFGSNIIDTIKESKYGK